MKKAIDVKLKAVTKLLVVTFIGLFVISFNMTPAQAFAGTLENGNLAYAQSEFNKGSACDYLPGFETGYDAWHLVLTTRGATFQQDPTNPKVSVNLNMVFMRQDGSLFVIRSGAWVQTGKGAYVYTRVADRIRIVQTGSLALINGSDSGMRLSHTCPGSGTAATTATPTPTPATTSSPTATPTTSPSASATPTVSPSATPTASPSPSVSPSPTPASTRVPTLAPRPSTQPSAVQVRPTGTRSPLPTPSPSAQAIGPTPTPTPTPEVTPTPSAEATPVPTPTPEPTSSPGPTTVPSPPPVEDPKNVIFVDPVKPTTVDPKTFEEPPASPVVITKEPTFGDIKVNDNGTFTYTPPATPPARPIVDVVEFRYTNLSGEAVVVRKEFVITIKGDVPSIIQTGGDTTPFSNNLGLGVLLLVVLGLLTRLFAASKRGQSNA